MRVAALKIQNFRGIGYAEIPFRTHTVLIGANNVGKTTIVEALALLLGRERMVRDLTEHDFYGSTPGRSDRIRIVGTITDFPSNNTERNPEWFAGGAIPKWIDPVTGKLKPAATSKDDKLAAQIAVDCRFDEDSLEVEIIRYFFDDDMTGDVFDDEHASRVPPGIVKDLGFFLDSASRTWERAISFNSDLFRQVVQFVANKKPSAAVLAERDALRSPAAPLEEDPNLKKLVDDINAELAHYFARDVSLKLRVTTTDSAGVLSAVTPHYLSDHGVTVPARREGSGLVALQKLALLLQFGRTRIEQGRNFIIAIEEPELHIPPPLQRRLLYSMQGLATQSIITTHSPAVAASCSPTDLFMVRQSKGVLSATPLLTREISKDEVNPLRSLLLLNRPALVEALMHAHILVPEGLTENRWLAALVRAAEVAPSADKPGLEFTVKVGVIPTPDSAVVAVSEFLIEKHPSVSCIVDGDAQGTTYIERLRELTSRPSAVLLWPEEWTIEDVVVWVIAAEADVLNSPELMAHDIPNNTIDLVDRLKTKRSKDSPSGLKDNYVAHEALANAIASSEKCTYRVHLLLSQLAAVLAGETNKVEIFRKMPGQNTGGDEPDPPIWQFAPPVA